MRDSHVRGAWSIPVALIALTLSPHNSFPIQFGVAGHVRDNTGRPLPFVVVTSRTGNGFLSLYTDLSGRFDFGNRPHRPGHTLEFRSFGFVPQMVRLNDAQHNVDVIMHPVERLPRSEWSIGLADEVEIEVLSVDGSGEDMASLQRGVLYRLRLTSSGAVGCSRPGPVASRADGHSVVVAFAMFRRRRDCDGSMIEYAGTVDVRFEQAGPGEIRAIGRYADLVLPIFVKPAVN